MLETAWSEALRTGLVVYDPGAIDVECVDQPPYRYHFLPGRSTRPGAQRSAAAPPEGLRWAHTPCAFDEESFVRERETVRLERQGRTYHLVANRYPVRPLHYLPVRTSQSAPDELTQHVHGPHEIEDLLLLLILVGSPYHVYFNSNRGADNSQSGSSVNHWHGQLFPLVREAGGLFLPTATVRQRHVEANLRVGRIEPWPAQHLLVDGDRAEFQAIALEVWNEVAKLNTANVAYNLEAAFVDERVIRMFLFPRRAAADAILPGVGTLSANFGGWELPGDIVIPTREILDWIRQHPEAAHELTSRRLRETTRAP